MQHYLTGLPWQLQLMPPELEIEETGETFLANACLKASQVAQRTGQWAIADDSGLEVEALEGAPGIYSARYGKTDAERIQRLLDTLGSELNRAAQFSCVIALARPDGSIACHAQGSCPGEILRAGRGEGGFGYDPIFYVPTEGKTFAELSSDVKRRLSHRGVAFQALLPQLQPFRADS
ncbi:Non-canonical purine NTP pyrophosphatase [Acaryochloris thomasi RCC1774]|uniref:dITP/XTP pyrophosphatase n=2 Tax=Acaryochloris TaxID=155977 RepID=A0A2W1JHP4_9CYAN|nr:Non-canonical purine NTP pyrophosphatase [Acaryochloris thomasi RCC1774]